METREERIKRLRQRFWNFKPVAKVIKSGTHTIDDIVNDINKWDKENEEKQYDEAKEFMEHNEHLEYK